MNGNEEKKAIECLWRGDARVCTLLGPQKPPAEGLGIRRSRFVYTLYQQGRYLLFHTLTREILAVEPQYIDFFADDRLFPASVLSGEVPAKLYEHHFLVPENTPESQTYLELKEILVLKEELPRGITSYVILPTTTCNARCFYCFEQGMRYRKMSRETVEDTLAFILRHKPTDKKKIHIHWFGGEPMCAPENIDRICEGLTAAGIEFSAEMTSNGSLFTEELAKKAAEVWKVFKIQITLDGMAEEYAKRKRYSSAVQDPFGTVIRNMHFLIAAGIKITVRLNVDENNLGEIYRVVDFLKAEFTDEEKKKLLVYAHSLFGKPGEALDACPRDAGSDVLESRVLEINDYCERQGLRPHDLAPVFSLKSHFCRVTAPECNVVIDAAGQLFACDAMTENMRYGDVKTDIDMDVWNRVASPCAVREECARCVFLPECTEFDRCPNRMPYDSCYRDQQRRLERELRFVYFVSMEQKAKKQQEAAANNAAAKEAATAAAASYGAASAAAAPENAAKDAAGSGAAAQTDPPAQPAEQTAQKDETHVSD